MNHTPMNVPQSPEDILKQLISACDFLPQMLPWQSFGVKATLTELMPDVKSRNWQRARNSIDLNRDILIWQIEQQSEVPVEVKEHQKEGVRWQAQAFKWLIDGMELEHRMHILHGRA